MHLVCFNDVRSFHARTSGDKRDRATSKHLPGIPMRIEVPFPNTSDMVVGIVRTFPSLLLISTSTSPSGILDPTVIRVGISTAFFFRKRPIKGIPNRGFTLCIEAHLVVEKPAECSKSSKDRNIFNIVLAMINCKIFVWVKRNSAVVVHTGAKGRAPGNLSRVVSSTTYHYWYGTRYQVVYPSPGTGRVICQHVPVHG